MVGQNSYLSKTFLLSFLILISFPLQGQHLDIAILRKINLNRNTDFDGSMNFLSNSIAPITIGTPVLYFVHSIATKDSTSRNRAINIGLAVVSTSVISTVLKYSIQRPRPFVTFPDLDYQKREKTPSFPSGHTAHAFAVATSISLHHPRWYIALPSYLWAAGVGYSRLHLGVHYPSDVLVGAMIGAGSSYLVYKGNKWLHKQNDKKKPLLF
jgi:membrane-associated phospholipid phosphatase